MFQLFFMFLSTAYIIAVATQQAGGPAKVRDTMVCHDCHVADDEEVTLVDIVGAYCWNLGRGGGHGI